MAVLSGRALAQRSRYASRLSLRQNGFDNPYFLNCPKFTGRFSTKALRPSMASGVW